MSVRKYCAYCGRVAHRCQCNDDDSRLHQFFARHPKPPQNYYPKWIKQPYKRGVPPQVKRKIRYQLRKHYSTWYANLAEQYGEHCANCGILPDDKQQLVLDHIISVAQGGQSQLDNLQLLCAECNRIKGKLCIDCYSDTI